MTPAPTKRIFGLDLLRSAAVLAVILYHFPLRPRLAGLRMLFHDGWAGVDLFFVLSGYLIGGQFFQALARGQQPSLTSFYLKRFLRTLPNYYLVLALLFLVFPSFDATPTQPLWHYVIFIQNFGRLTGFAPSWSLCVEEHFYLLFPLVALGLRRWGRAGRIARSGAKLIVAGLVFELALRAAIWFAIRPDLYDPAAYNEAYLRFCQWIYYPTYARLDGIVVGVGLAALRAFRPEKWRRLLLRAPALLTGGFALLALAAVAIHWRMGFAGSVFGLTALALGFGLVLIPATVLTSTGVPTLDWLVHWIAQLSYALYLVNVPILRLSEHLVREHAWPAPTLIPLSFGLIGMASLLLYFLVEKPMLIVRSRLVR